MPFANLFKKPSTAYLENAFFARLAALNASIEAARAGCSGRGFAQDALSTDALLEAFLRDIQAKHPIQK